MSQPTQSLPADPTPARRSGGPRTPEGKERSRRNALKHGLRARVLIPDEMVADVTNRTADFARELRPTTTYQRWLVGEIALATVRIDRCAALGIVDLQRRRDLTPEAWDLQRRREVAALGAGLARDPARVRATLETTAHGVDWLIEHWDGLAQVLQIRGEWSDDQKQLALHLLGVPLGLRRSPHGVPLELLRGTSRLPGPAELPAFIARQIQRLRALQASLLHDQDEDQRLYSGLGLPVAEDRTSRGLRRHEQSCRRALGWAHGELRRLQAEPAGRHEPTAPISEPTAPISEPTAPISEPTAPISEPPATMDQTPRHPTPPVGHGRDRRPERIAADTPTPGGRGAARRLLADLPPVGPTTLDLAITPARPGPGHRA